MNALVCYACVCVHVICAFHCVSYIGTKLESVYVLSTFIQATIRHLNLRIRITHFCLRVLDIFSLLLRY
ncbi:hypothetical protein AMTRI_Chr11g151800 [Amborella trichopoda]